MLQQLPPAEAVTPANWPEVLRSVCWLLPEMHEDPSQRDALQKLQQAEGYEALAAGHRLELLRTLVDSLYATFTVRERLRENETKQFELTRDFNAAAREREAAERSAETRETERAREARRRPPPLVTTSHHHRPSPPPPLSTTAPLHHHHPSAAPSRPRWPLWWPPFSAPPAPLRRSAPAPALRSLLSGRGVARRRDQSAPRRAARGGRGPDERRRRARRRHQLSATRVRHAGGGGRRSGER